MTESPYDPLSLKALGASLVRELNERPHHPLPPEERFPGCGVYALYYLGSFEPYRVLAERGIDEDGHPRVPIYVGKAVPSGSRKGATEEFEITKDDKIHSRLREHASTITDAENLSIDGFRCRYLITAPVWIRLAESVAVNAYRPLWNSLIDGFGIHDPGSGRYDQRRSVWDTLHPGRSWAEKLQDREESADQIGEKAAEFLEINLPAKKRREATETASKG